MIEQLFSESWYRVADVRPALQPHVRLIRQTFRGEPWFVLQDRLTGQFCRITAQARLLVAGMDGRKTLDEIWQSVCAELGDDMPAQDEVIRLLDQMHRANLLRFDRAPDVGQMSERYRRERKGRLLQYLRSPMAIRLPVLDPSRFLDRTAWLARILFHPASLVIWLLWVLFGMSQAAVHWAALSSDFTDQAFSAGNWLAIAAIYPVIKLLHELGHGYAVKRWGGDVHELGLMFLVFVPVPYVDASASTAFRGKYQRMLVAFAGIGVEAFLAATAIVLWTLAEPGVFRAMLFNIALIGGVSTFLFNGNPLLRFDAYYVLADWLEMPNLGRRANGYVGYWLKRYLLRLPDEVCPSGSVRESVWLFAYSIASFVYRMTISLGIALYVASEYFFVGVLLAVWFVANGIVLPFLRVARSTLREARQRYFGARLRLAAGGGVLILAGFAFLPLPYFTLAQGVVWAPPDTQIRAGESCFVDALLPAHGQHVRRGEILARCSEDELVAELETARARLDELQARYRHTMAGEAVERGALLDEIEHMQADIERKSERVAALEIRSPAEGRVMWLNPRDLPGRFVSRGDYLGYVDTGESSTVRFVVSQDDVTEVRTDSLAVQVRPADALHRVRPGHRLREVPAGTRAIPDPALSTRGGGPVEVDPASEGAMRALSNWFSFEVHVPGDPAGRIGERVYVRIRHGDASMGSRLWRVVRRLFLEEFGV